MPPPQADYAIHDVCPPWNPDRILAANPGRRESDTILDIVGCGTPNVAPFL